MTDKPILFSGPMVQAILAGRKTMTRRVLNPQPDSEHFFRFDLIADRSAVFRNPHTGYRQDVRVPISTGDRLYVREAWSGEHWLSGVKPSERLLCAHDSRLVPLIPETWYWADGGPEEGDWERPRPSIHMPRWASRITLPVADVKVERVQDISEEGAVAEGCRACDDGSASARDAFWFLWDSLNKKRGFGWDVNPWVAAYTFTVHRGNIDEAESG